MSKPPYRVPLVAELPAHGVLTVASTFSGCGGSCLGYRMAGFRVAWANEFLPAAQASYRANFKETILDERDICQIQPVDILNALKIKVGELDLLDGSPPCQAFSTAGKREKGWGKERLYENGAKQCNENLFSEYIRLLRGLQPKVFVAENVSGLAKGTCKGFFLEILSELKASGYLVECRLLDAQWLGVPQQRQRVIFVGVRMDLARQVKPTFPKPLPYRYSVQDALPWMMELKVRTFTKGKPLDVTKRPMAAVQCTPSRTGLNRRETVLKAEMDGTALGKKVLEQWNLTKVGKSSPKYFQLQKCDTRKPSPSVTGPSGTGLTLPNEPRRFTIAELKRICAFPDDFVLVGSYAQQWERLGNSVPPVMMFHIAKTLRDEVFAKI